MVVLPDPVAASAPEASSVETKTPNERLLEAAKNLITLENLHIKLWGLYYGVCYE